MVSVRLATFDPTGLESAQEDTERERERERKEGKSGLGPRDAILEIATPFGREEDARARSRPPGDGDEACINLLSSPRGARERERETERERGCCVVGGTGAGGGQG